MKLFTAATSDILNYAPFSRNCNLSQCRQAYLAAVPTLADVQVFMNLGPVQPAAIDFTLINLCPPYDNATINSDCFIIAFNGSYWYAVYKDFTGADYSTYMISALVSYTDETTQVYFSEQYQNASDCDSLTKVSVCYPFNWNAEDINGIYIGQPDMSQPVSGNSSIFYHHQYWVKGAEIIETSNKISFTANLYKNFNSDLTKLYEFRPTDKVPGWYKDYLLAVYFRGQILINDSPALLSDINFDIYDEGADLWKAYAVLTREIKGAFGCADIMCPVDCICVPVTLPAITFADAMVSVPYHKTIVLGGTQPFILSDIVKPGWMTIVIVGGNIVISGTPAEEDTEGSAVTFTVGNNCGTAALTDGFIAVDEFVPSDLTVLLSRSGPSGAGSLAALFTGGVGPYTYHFGFISTGPCAAVTIDTPDGIGIEDAFTTYTLTLYAGVTYQFYCTVFDSLGNTAVSNFVTNPGCLVPETMIKTYMGLDIELGELIKGVRLVGPEENFITHWKKITVDTLYSINNGLLECTDGHVHILMGGTLMQTAHLKEGDVLHGGVKITSIGIRSGTFEVVDISTTNGTYWANSILTHNKFACP